LNSSGPANQLEVQDINTTRPGHMVMIPFTSNVDADG
jgi:hypothetical protein